jgi:hypothetical protein
MARLLHLVARLKLNRQGHSLGQRTSGSGQIVGPRPGGDLGDRGNEPVRQVRETLMRDTLTLVSSHTRQHRQAFWLAALDGADLGLLSPLGLDRRADSLQPLPPPPRGSRPCSRACSLAGEAA